MEIIWYGHSCFRLRGREATIVTDPFDNSLGYPRLRLTAQVVTVSHQDPHHSYLEGVGGEPRIVDGPGEYEISSSFITGVRTFRDSQKGRERGRNTAYLIELDDLVVCHLGDLGHVLSTEQIEALENPDVLLIPVGGNCTIDGVQAAEVVSQLEPKLVIPMHYGSEAVKLELDSVDKFCKEMAVENVTPPPKLMVTRSGLPDETSVVVLQPSS